MAPGQGGRREQRDRRPLRARAPPRDRRHVDRPAGLRPPPRAPRRGQAAGRASRRRPVVRLRASAARRWRRARLVHPNVVQVFDFGLDEAQHQHFIVMEYVQGQSCAQLLRDRGHLDVDEAVEILTQACRGLDYAHRNGVVHRDVKPGNLLRSQDGVVKLADFGIAKATEQSSDHPDRLGARHRRLSGARAGARRGGRSRAPTSTRSASSPTSCCRAACRTRRRRCRSWRSSSSARRRCGWRTSTRPCRRRCRRRSRSRSRSSPRAASTTPRRSAARCATAPSGASPVRRDRPDLAPAAGHGRARACCAAAPPPRPAPPQARRLPAHALPSASRPARRARCRAVSRRRRCRRADASRRDRHRRGERRRRGRGPWRGASGRHGARARGGRAQKTQRRRLRGGCWRCWRSSC